jgi:2-polyprenyl-3-methyl-5-hydroxy-6-metoxy-1,4-benzoquinol methylase
VKTVIGCIDAPGDGDLVQRHAFHVDGWAHAEGAAGQHVRAYVDDELVGSTSLILARPDVAAALQRPETARSGFSFACVIPERLRDRSTINVEIALIDDLGGRHTIAKRWLRLSKQDYRQNGHGDVLRETSTAVLKRENVYGSGPPSPIADGRCVSLVRRYLRRNEHILDVGCGIGAYGRVLAPEGFNWTGCEVRADFCAAVRACGLRAEVVDGPRLPFGDASFDAALCIEVLEHIDDYAAFVAEIRRVVKRRAVFSVPNFESIPVMSLNYAIPWHMLESDHKNFFTRFSLGATLSASFAHVEVFEYGPLDRFRTEDGLPVFNHLFAVADVAAP